MPTNQGSGLWSATYGGRKSESRPRLRMGASSTAIHALILSHCMAGLALKEVSVL